MHDLRANYWGLGNNWWKQIIDRSYHSFGPEVFDKGLHGKEVEPGFLQGIKAASEVALKYIGQDTSVDIYKEIHKAACSHFNYEDEKSLVLMNGSEAGAFFREAEYALFNLLVYDDAYGYYLTLYDPSTHVENYAQNGFTKMERYYPGITKLTPDKVVLENSSRTKVLEWENRMHAVALEIAQLSLDLGFSEPIASLQWKDDKKYTIRLNYRDLSTEELEKSVQFLFDRFNQTQNKSRQLIGELYQHLEWLHPFPDGQGRTDLIVQGERLTNYGFHPPILRNPYASSIFTSREWDAKLTQGLENWKQEKCKI